MQWYRNLAIQKKLHLAIMLACAVLLGLAAVIFLVKDIAIVNRALVAKYTSLAAVLAENVSSALAFNDHKAARQTLNTLRSEPSILYAEIHLTNGESFEKVILQNEMPLSREFIDNPKDYLPLDKGKCFEPVIEFRHLHVCMKIELLGEKLGMLFLTTDLRELEAEIASDLIITLVVFLVALGLAHVVVRPLAKTLAGPILHLTSLVKNVSQHKDYSLRAETTREDELGTLAKGLNHMLEEIQEREQRLKEYSYGLERHVAERTVELERTVGELKYARDKAESANRAKTEFLSNMSHELRTPLNAVIGFAQLFELDETLPDQYKENANEILKAGTHLLALINDVLDLATIEAGKLKVTEGAVNVCDLCNECGSLMQTLLNKYEVSLHFQLNTCENIRLLADYTRLRQVMINLITNAIKYNKPQGEVWVSCEVYDDKVRLLVKDTGKGVPQDRINELFEPFNRLDAGMGNIEGTGIGLVISKRLIEMMGGHLGVQSVVGEGSTFWIELKRVGTGEQTDGNVATAAEMKDKSHKSLGKLLYIEDNPVNAQVLQSLLEKTHPHSSLEIAASGEQALQKLQEQKPDIIFLDIHLPGMNGYSVLKEIRQNPVYKSIPVIALTAYAMPTDIENGEAAGFDAYLTKPLKINELTDTLNRLSRGNSAGIS